MAAPAITYRKLTTPHSTSELHALVELARRHFAALHDQSVTVAAELYSGLIDKQHGPGLSRTLARRICRHVWKAAGSSNVAAAEWATVWREYSKAVNSGANRTRRKFDVTK